MFAPEAKFLIVDDSDVTRKTIRTALAQLGLENVEEASDGAAAFEKIASAAKSRQYSLVFCDINMPRMDGFELLEACRSETTLANVPFLMVTSESQKQAVIRAVMQGVSGYVVKPFGIDDIKDKIKETYDKVKHFNATAM